MNQTISLNGTDWQFKPFVGEDWRLRKSFDPQTQDLRGWLPAAVPGSAQNDLWQAGEIPDPYVERNSLLSEWAAARSYVYKRSFYADPAWQTDGGRVRLVFKGVDLDAHFFLNGAEIGEHHDMYTSAVFEIGSQLKWGEDNLLAVAIDTAPLEQPQIGYTSRVRTLKARMNYWWDFCPRMVHQGIWDGVEVRISGPAALEDVWVQPTLSEDGGTARVSARVRLSTLQKTSLEAEMTLFYDGQAVQQTTQLQDVSPGESVIDLQADLSDPLLWWPNGMGKPELYTAQVLLRVRSEEGKRESDCRDVTFGVRDVKLIPNEGAGQEARGYTLQVNGQRIYARGWNWVPMDAMYGVERPERLRHLLALAKDANVNLLRVWGGGLIEKDAFYDLCDALGLLVWQEFIQSSSGIDNIPPDDPEVVAWMAGEARQIVEQRRNHPSLALWCGGNELMWRSGKPLDESHPMLAALRQVVAEEDPSRAWLPTSSSGPQFSNGLPDEDKLAEDFHDVHGPWEYQGQVEQYTLYNGATSLFHSEFGAEGLTNRRALDATIAPEHQQPVSLDNPVWMHRAAWWVKERAWQQVFGPIPDVAAAVRGTQFTQFEGVRYAIEANRRRSFHNSGSIPWQFNEPYPMAACTSAVDYFGEPKPVYYGVRRAYSPTALTARYDRLTWDGCETFEAELWVAPQEGTRLENARLVWRLVGLDGTEYAGGERSLSSSDDHPLKAGQARFPIRKMRPDDPEKETSSFFLLDLSLTDANGGALAANRYLFTTEATLAPIFSPPETQVAARVWQDGSDWLVTLSNTGSLTALYVQLALDKDPRAPENLCQGWANLSANYFCLLPKEEKVVRVNFEALGSTPKRLALWAWNVAEQIIEG